MKKEKQGMNPYLPSWEYVPDGEPYVFGDRVYVYGSHDRFNGYAYCLNDYICWSAPIEDLSSWRYEGVIYKKDDDPKNQDGEMCLYAPDVTVGPDGRYYLYYVLDQLPIVSVAVCDQPAGVYQFYGYVHYSDGILLGERNDQLHIDEPQFDPAVLTEGEITYLYTGFCKENDKTRTGAMVTILGEDMLTVLGNPVTVVPSGSYGQNSSFQGHEFFEASSIRKIMDTYYFIYSSVLKHELCYAVSKYPDKEYIYGGTIVSNNDLGIASYKDKNFTTFYGGNNHGSIAKINGKYYIFYHRHTNGTNFSRQGCIEPIEIIADGRIPQVEMTSSGPNGVPLMGKGEYPAYIACNLFCKENSPFTAPPGEWLDCRFPKITQDGRDGEEEPGYIANMRDSAVAGFKYFDCRRIKGIKVKVRGSGKGKIEVLTALDQKPEGIIHVSSSNEWKEYSAPINIPDGVQALYFRYSGERNISFFSFTLV